MSGAADGPVSVAYRVLVSILHFDQPEEASAAARSFSDQTHPGTDVQVLDNGSAAESLARLRRLAPGVAVRESGANLGYTGGNNIALEQGTREGYDAVLVANSDVVVERDTIACLVETALAQKRAGVVGGVELDGRTGAVRTTGSTRFPDWRFRFRWHAEEPAAGVPRRRVAFVQGALVFFTRRALECGVRFDDRLFMFFDEVELGWALADAGLEAWVDHRVRYRHNNRPESFRNLTGYFQQRNRLYLARKRFPFWKSALYVLYASAVELPAKILVRALQGHAAFARACWRGHVDALAGRMGRGRLDEIL